jgi:hypothetical protein
VHGVDVGQPGAPNALQRFLLRPLRPAHQPGRSCKP